MLALSSSFYTRTISSGALWFARAATSQKLHVQLFACRDLLKALHSPDEYRVECGLLVAGSQRSELMRANLNGITPLIAATAFGASCAVVRTLALLTADDIEDEVEEEEERKEERETAAGVGLGLRCRSHLLARHVGTANTALHFAAIAHDGNGAVVDALLAVPTDAELVFLQHFWAPAAADAERGQYTSDRSDELRSAWKARTPSAINARNVLGETPLFVACKTSNVEAARRLLHYGADPNIQVQQSRTLGLIQFISRSSLLNWLVLSIITEQRLLNLNIPTVYSYGAIQYRKLTMGPRGYFSRPPPGQVGPFLPGLHIRTYCI